MDQRIGHQAYILSLANMYKIHPVFYISLLKKWKAEILHDGGESTADEELEAEEPYYKFEELQ